MISGKLQKILLAGWLVLVASAAAEAGATITSADGTFTVGISDTGELYDPDTSTGFRRNADGFDPLSPGTPRDSWGVSAGTNAAYADSSYFGLSGLSSATLTAAANSAVATTLTTLGLSIVQSYSFVASNILAVHISVGNTTGSTISDVKFKRTVDWDIRPTELAENTVAPPIAGFPQVIASSYSGFDHPSPLQQWNSAAGGFNGVADNGAGITISLGDILAGQTKVFDYFYAISDGVTSLGATVFNALLAGQTYGIVSQSSENGSWPNQGENYAMLGVSGVTATAVPGPVAAAGMPALLLAAGSIAAARRRGLFA